MSKKRWTVESMEDQRGRVAIVTGANSGIGFEAAKALAAKNARVIVASRNAERGGAAVAAIRDGVAGGDVELLLLDLASLASVQRFADEFSQRFDRLDLLINNAGVMMPKRREETADGFELQIGTNHLGHFALTMRLLPLLVRTPGARVVNVSSSAQNFGKFDPEDLQWTDRSFHRMGSYGASKVANMLFTLELQRRLEEVGADTIATACHPGWTATNLQKTSPLIRFLNPLFGMQSWQGALPTLYAAVAPEAEGGGYYGPDGLGTLRGYPTRNKPSKVSTDGAAATRLWELSEELTGVSMPAAANG